MCIRDRTQAQLRSRLEPEKGIFIAESPKVIARALDAGYQMCIRDRDKTTFTIGGIETFQETARRNRLRAVTKVTKFETCLLYTSRCV